MAFEVWTEKYRPRDFDGVVGQEHIVDRLRAFVESKALPHLLFAGPPGTGKTTLALIIARKLYGDAWRQNTLELNASVTPETPLMVRRNGKIKRTTIGKLAEEYFKDEESRYAFPTDLEVLSLDRDFKVKFVPVRNISRHKVDKVARIKFEGGEVRTTLDHSVVVMDDEGELREVEVSELRKGDLLISFKTVMESCGEALDPLRFAPQRWVRVERSNGVENPTVMREIGVYEEVAWFFGSFLAEGCVGFNPSASLAFTFSYPEEVRLASSIASNHFGFDAGSYTSGTSGRESGTRPLIASPQPARFLKVVPSFVFAWPLSLRRAFLRGYQGSVSRRCRLGRASNSSELLVDVAWLGRVSGLDTSCLKNGVRVFWKNRVYVGGELIPASPLINFLERLGGRIRINWRYLLRHQLYSKGSKRVKKELVKRILKSIEVKNLAKEEKVIFQRLMRLVESDIYFVRIKEIRVEDYDGYVYDLSVPSVEVFWGGTVPILLHNSDERGIDVIRHKVKDFARTRPIGDFPYKLIYLDESDALTQEAQNALRRTMEDFTSTARFILSCNYSSRIIEPIQSRCAIFRFRPIGEEAIAKRLDFIAQQEGLEIEEDGLKAILYVAEGDLRTAINVLQAAASVKRKISEDVVYEVTARARPGEVKEIVMLALQGNFLEARDKLNEMMVTQGLAGEDVIREIHRVVLGLEIPEKLKVELLDRIGEYDFRLIEGADPRIQLDALLAQIVLAGRDQK